MARSDLGSDSRSQGLPDRPSLESLKKQAKALLHAWKRGEAPALRRVREWHPRPDSFSSLRDAQLVVAREYQSASWVDLSQAVEQAILAALPTPEKIEIFLRDACLSYDGTDSPRRIGRAAQMLEASPELASQNIYTAAATGNVPALRRFLAIDPDAVRCNGGPRGWLPFLYLCYSRIPDAPPGRDALLAARVLIEAGADANAHFVMADRYHFTALTGAIGEGEGGLEAQPPHAHARALAVLLLEAGAEGNDSQALYNTHFSPGNEWIELLLSYGLSARDLANWFPEPGAPRILDFLLGIAITRGFTERVALLLRHGADPNGANTYDGRAHWENAHRFGRPEMAVLLEVHGARRIELSPAARFRAACMIGDEIAARALFAGDPAVASDAMTLFDAIEHGGRDTAVDLLLELGGDLGAREPTMGATALHAAVRSGRPHVATRLLALGAELDVRDTSVDSTPASWADHFGHAALRDLLLDRSRDVFDLACWGRVEQLRALLAADPTAATRRRAHGVTALHRLTTAGPRGAEIIDLLCAHGADPNARTDDGATPLARALETNEEVAELLRAQGAQ